MLSSLLPINNMVLSVQRHSVWDILVIFHFSILCGYINRRFYLAEGWVNVCQLYLNFRLHLETYSV